MITPDTAKNMQRSAVPSCNQRLAKRRAQMRWNSFVASPGSRLEGLMLGRLGPALWADFVRHASLYREA